MYVSLYNSLSLYIYDICIHSSSVDSFKGAIPPLEGFGLSHASKHLYIHIYIHIHIYIYICIYENVYI